MVNIVVDKCRRQREICLVGSVVVPICLGESVGILVITYMLLNLLFFLFVFLSASVAALSPKKLLPSLPL